MMQQHSLGSWLSDLLPTQIKAEISAVKQLEWWKQGMLSEGQEGPSNEQPVPANEPEAVPPVK